MLKKRYKKFKRWYNKLGYTFDWKISAILTLSLILVFMVLF